MIDDLLDKLLGFIIVLMGVMLAICIVKMLTGVECGH